MGDVDITWTTLPALSGAKTSAAILGHFWYDWLFNSSGIVQAFLPIIIVGRIPVVSRLLIVTIGSIFTAVAGDMALLVAFVAGSMIGAVLRRNTLVGALA